LKLVFIIILWQNISAGLEIGEETWYIRSDTLEIQINFRQSFILLGLAYCKDPESMVELTWCKPALCDIDYRSLFKQYASSPQLFSHVLQPAMRNASPCFGEEMYQNSSVSSQYTSLNLYGYWGLSCEYEHVLRYLCCSFSPLFFFNKFVNFCFILSLKRDRPSVCPPPTQ
jgi:hypothetical protein